jgi:hypothetical protein
MAVFQEETKAWSKKWQLNQLFFQQNLLFGTFYRYIYEDKKI